MAAKIPVTVITGFLGSGKTTLIREQLQNNQGRRIAVLVNEFGEIGIDGDLLRSCRVCDEDGKEITPNIVELTNGCLCCTVQEEFLPTMQELLKRRDLIDCILIETSGLALPKPLIQAFRWQEIRNGATVDGVIAVVDCEAVASGRLVSDLDAVNAQRQEDPNLHHDAEEEHEHDDDINSINIVTDQAFEPTQLLTSLKQAIADQEIYRIKGFVNVPNKPMRMVLQGVGDRLETSYDRLWASDEPRQTRLVFIGQALERSQIESALSL